MTDDRPPYEKLGLQHISAGIDAARGGGNVFDKMVTPRNLTQIREVVAKGTKAAKRLQEINAAIIDGVRLKVADEGKRLDEITGMTPAIRATGISRYAHTSRKALLALCFEERQRLIVEVQAAATLCDTVRVEYESPIGYIQTATLSGALASARAQATLLLASAGESEVYNAARNAAATKNIALAAAVNSRIDCKFARNIDPLRGGFRVQ